MTTKTIAAAKTAQATIVSQPLTSATKAAYWAINAMMTGRAEYAGHLARVAVRAARGGK